MRDAAHRRARNGAGPQYHGSSPPPRRSPLSFSDRPCPDSSPYDRDLDRNPANYTPLSPLSLIARTAYTYPQRLSVIHGDRRYTWAETYARSRRLASALVRAGIGKGDTVAVMAANTPEMVELHFGVPMTGGVLNTLNTRLDAETIAFMLKHGEAKVLVTDTRVLADRREGARADSTRSRIVVDIVDPLAPLRQAAREHRLRGVHRGRRSGVRLAASRRRVGRDLAQLHVGHDRQSRRASSTTIAART